MARGITDKANSLGTRLVVLLFSAVFALAFGLGGYAIGLKPLAQTLWAAREVRSWQPVQAQVLAAELKEHSDGDGTSYQVRARYRYEFAGRPYESTRIGLDPTDMADNISDWHHRWHTQLQGAQSSGQRITVLVDPLNPSHSLIDPSIRWALQIFRLPFALVFTAVGLAAAWVFLLTLLGRGSPRAGEEGGVAPPELPKASAGQSAGPIWFFTVFWCGIAFPMAALVWMNPRSPGLVKAFISIFVMVGVGLLGLAVRKTYTAWRYAGAALTTLPAQPRGGQPFQATLLLPERAAAHQGGQNLQLRLAQYRVDESSSGSPERRVESFEQKAQVYRTPDGGLRLVARFEVPLDAPPHGGRMSGERVDWRLELLHNPGDAAELTYDVPVQAAPQTFEGPPPDRFDRRAAFNEVYPIALPAEGEANPMYLPEHSRLEQTPQAWLLTFGQNGWRGAGILVVLGLALEAFLNDRVSAVGLALPRAFFGACAWWALVVFALHALTRRWTLAVQDNGIVVRRGSWLWSRALSVPGDASQALVHKLLYSTGSGSSEHGYHAVHARGLDGKLVQLTPGLDGAVTALGLGRAIATAWGHRRGRFTAGMHRPARVEHSRPAWGVLLVAAALALSIWGGQRTGKAPRPAVADSPTPSVSYSAVDGRLLDAQNAGDAAALRAALAAGANPNLLAPNGSSVLMLAAHRGQMEHIEALLAAGAKPDLRQTQKDSELGDTALLRAFYGGNLAAAQRLVQAGAGLSARNRWDWGPVHMAAQSGCIACLEWLAAQGQPLDEPAMASRGETPTMLAAGRGRVQALQWFEARGIDLARKDPHGKTALDWARFKKQAEAEQWLLERTR